VPRDRLWGEPPCPSEADRWPWAKDSEPSQTEKEFSSPQRVITSHCSRSSVACLAGSTGECDWMRPSLVRVSADPGDRADVGNDSLLDAVVERVRDDVL
jgi:hypothetical protein